jgi:hypothetical protein
MLFGNDAGKGPDPRTQAQFFIGGLEPNSGSPLFKRDQYLVKSITKGRNKPHSCDNGTAHGSADRCGIHGDYSFFL